MGCRHQTTKSEEAVAKIKADVAETEERVARLKQLLINAQGKADLNRLRQRCEDELIVAAKRTVEVLEKYHNSQAQCSSDI